MRNSDPPINPAIWRSRYIRVITALITLLFLALILDFRSDVQAQDEIPLPEEALLLPGTGGRGTRSAISADPIQAQRLDGIPSVKAGDIVKSGDGAERKWETLKRTDANVWKHDRLPGGYLRLEVKSGKDRVAMLEVAGHLHTLVNGEPRVADPYGNGMVKVPVLLRNGTNELLLQARNRELAVRLRLPPSEMFFNTSDPTVPDLIVGDDREYWAALPVVNATMEHSNSSITHWSVRARVGDGKAVETPIASIVPLGIFKAPFRFHAKADAGSEKAQLNLELIRSSGDSMKVVATAELSLRVRQPAQEHMRTLISNVDGSVQYYSVVPANPGKDDPRPGLTLTLHGAGVEARGQAACYAPKSWTHVVAATNRRPFGFDWEDWGRLDALEVLEAAERELKPDPRRRWLTGHSMGGHGTWHLGVTFPDKFAAIGPSAGWISMFTYAGMRRPDNPDPIAQLLQRCSSASETLALVQNTRMQGIYVLHGDKDDNVPVQQARTMKQVLEKFHTNMTYHEQPGAGHWWGNDCVDWKPMFEFFHKHTLPDPAAVTVVDFTTASPAVSADCHWARIEAQSKFLETSHVKIDHDPIKRSYRGTTQNVARLSLSVAHLPAGEPIAVELDGRKLTVAWPQGQHRVWLNRNDDGWAAGGPTQAIQKGPARYGPFKEAFRNRMIFVHGTKGTPAETAALLAKARFDAETFWYRGNGAVEVIPDVQFDAGKTKDRNVILYGNTDTNSAWGPLFGDSPVQVQNGAIRIGQREVKGDDLACLFIRPRPGSDIASVGAVAATGIKGIRATHRLPVFVSGVAYPDCFLFSSEALATGAKGIRAAGFFGPDWSVERGEFIWRE